VTVSHTCSLPQTCATTGGADAPGATFINEETLTMYRGQSGMWSWLLHRITGVAILLFLLVHIVDITMLGFGPTVYDDALQLFATPVVRFVSLGLIAAVLYHSFNGVRITLIDFWAKGAKYQAQMFWGVLVLTIAGFVSMGYFVIKPILDGCPGTICGK
jgi:succinate dehydrogenase / fumarate reductase cytochrome b subunit